MLGVNNVIMKSQQFSMNMDQLVSKNDMKLHLSYAKLCYHLGPSDRQLLCDLVGSVMSHVRNSIENECLQSQIRKEVIYSDSTTKQKTIPTTITTTIPTTLQEIRKYYLEGKNAIITNLPTPVVHKTQCNHSYVRIKDVIQHLFAYGSYPELLSSTISENNTTTSFPTECKKVSSIKDEIITNMISDTDVTEILVTEWHDDFEPNTQSKQNRGSVWILSLTVLSERDIKNSKWYTFPITVGERTHRMKK